MESPSEQKEICVEQPTKASVANMLKDESSKGLDFDPGVSKMIYVSLKSPLKEFSIKKSTSLGQANIADSLIERHMVVETKLSNKRMEQKANLIGQMREVPEINLMSRKIGEAKNLSMIEASIAKADKNTSKIQQESPDPWFSQSIQKNEMIKNEGIKSPNLKIGKNKEENKKPEVKHERVSLEDVMGSPLPPDMFKNIKKKEQRKSETKFQEGKKSIVERSLTWKRQIDNKKAEKRKIKDIELMSECTFKPQLSPKSEFNDTGSMITKHYNEAEQKRKVLSMKSLSPKMNSKYISDVNIFPCEYSQISPTNFSVKHKLGFNFEDFIAKAKPMANYQLVNQEMEME
ncbi:hypothetical protein SteCoe_32027 [Stentor coeruleus]|uniref:Uncharacterized protein n=1 Tax=Stentor coeruleus TaxID=5963 RepID=A0A1R2B049_9CILI|nr:hypothetical protein SteCoe_32027 [Stentor coeruleus]